MVTSDNDWAVQATDVGDWKPGEPISYIRPDIPEFETPPFGGERYEALVPDTLDLQERARLSVHVLTEATDPLADYEPYYHVRLRHSPIDMGHSWWHSTAGPKYQEALALMRLISGSEQNDHVDRRWMEAALKSQGPDGLVHSPMRGRPWGAFPDFGVPVDDQPVSPFGCGAWLSAMRVYAERDGGELWRDATRRLVDGLISLAVDTGDYAYFWPSVMIAGRDRPPDIESQPHLFEAESSLVAHGLVNAHRLLDYEPAITLAKKVLTYVRRFYYRPDGSFLRGPDDPVQAHFHAHLRGLLAMLNYAQVTDDDDSMEFVVRSFEYAIRMGNDLVGYFPEYVNSPEWEGSEICEVADMTALAAKLSEAGIGDYWDNADRWLRNMYTEAQLLRTDWLYRLPEAGLVNPRPSDLPTPAADPYSTTDRVPERVVGSFAGWPAANDWYVGNGTGIMGCCTANGSRFLYRVWERMLHHDSGRLRVNLLLNRASPWADVDSYIPYEGRVDVKVKQPVDLSVRIPEWVTPGQTRSQVNGEDRRLGWDGRYAQVGSVVPGDVATLTFPIEERTDIVHIEKQRFTLVRKGNEVVVVDPPGRYGPLYQRQHYRENTVRWRKATRFVSSETFRS